MCSFEKSMRTCNCLESMLYSYDHFCGLKIHRMFGVIQIVASNINMNCEKYIECFETLFLSVIFSFNRFITNSKQSNNI